MLKIQILPFKLVEYHKLIKINNLIYLIHKFKFHPKKDNNN